MKTQILKRNKIFPLTWNLMKYSFLSSVFFCCSDPMKPFNYEPSENEEIQILLEGDQKLLIEAIVIKGDLKIVRINQKSYEIGQIIERYIIEDMTIDKVLLKDQETGEIFELTLGTSWVVKQQHRGS